MEGFVGKAETEVDVPMRVNGLGPRNLALACQAHGATLLHISTDYVFDGNKEGPYEIWDMPNPINVYGKSKLWGENYVRSLMYRYFVVRTSWLFGTVSTRGTVRIFRVPAGLLSAGFMQSYSNQKRITVVRKLDILAKDLGSGRTVVMYNTLGQTDHNHLSPLPKTNFPTCGGPISFQLPSTPRALAATSK